MNASNKMLLNVAKFQGNSFYRFWVIKGDLKKHICHGCSFVKVLNQTRSHSCQSKFFKRDESFLLMPPKWDKLKWGFRQKINLGKIIISLQIRIIANFTYQKNITWYTYLLVFKMIESLQYMLKHMITFAKSEW